MFTVMAQRTRLSALALLLAAGLAGCDTQMFQPAQSETFGVRTNGGAVALGAAADRSVLQIIGQANAKSLLLFRDGKQDGEVPAPLGLLAIDNSGVLYDNPVNSSSVLVYDPPYKKLTRTVSFGRDSPRGIAVDPRTGVLAVSAERYEESGGPGPFYEAFFKKGSFSPCAVVQVPNSGLLYGGAFDRSGSLFVFDYDNTNSLGVGSIAGECDATALTYNALPAGGDWLPESYANFDSNNNLVFQSGFLIYAFAHPAGGKFGSPISTITLKRGKFETAFMYLSSDGHIWAVPEESPSNSNLLSEYNYPEGGAPINSERVKNARVAIEVPQQN
jgi:hypothetical protein